MNRQTRRARLIYHNIVRVRPPHQWVPWHDPNCPRCETINGHTWHGDIRYPYPTILTEVHS